MELLLNLAWFVLAVPAYLLWRSSRAANRRYGFSSLQCFLVLGCVLVLLFPVISATDDLHAMRNEIEESSVSKRTIRQAGSERASSWTHCPHAPVLWVDIAGFSFTPDQQYEIFSSSAFALASAPPLRASGRAPPASVLA